MLCRGGTLAPWIKPKHASMNPLFYSSFLGYAIPCRLLQGRLASGSSRDDLAPPGAGVDGEEEEEEEEDHWAKEQIRKGMGGLMRGAAPAAGTAGAQQAGSAGEVPAAGHPAWGARGVALAGGSQAGRISAAAAEVMQSLQQGLKRLQVRGRAGQKKVPNIL